MSVSAETTADACVEPSADVRAGADPVGCGADIVLLTATITAPADARFLARRDPALRLADYEQAFDFYLDQLAAGHIDGLVLCDNSGADLSAFAAQARAKGLAGRIELISFEGLDYPADYGRGYGEFRLVDHAMSHSALIAAAGPLARVWKITGRYRLRNLGQLVRSQPLGADLYCHCRSRRWRGVPWVDLYVMRWNRRAYDEIVRGAYPLLKQDAGPSSAEQKFRAHLDSRLWHCRIARRFTHLADIDGVRGADNRSYGSMRHRYLLRAAAHRLLPWVAV